MGFSIILISLSLFGIGYSQTAISSDCADDPEERCFALTDVQCVGIYKQWARLHCQLRCGYCPDGKWLPCTDEIDYCSEYLNGSCSVEIYGEFMRQKCRKTCNFCMAPTAYLTNNTNPTTALQVKDWCVDDPTVDCWRYADSKCLDIYSHWAKLHCPFRCGYCPNFYPACIDTISYCDEFGDNACDTKFYGTFMRKYCRRTCNLCIYPAQNMTPVTLPEVHSVSPRTASPTGVVISSQSSCGFSSQCEYNINVNHCTAQTTSSRNLHSSSSCPCSTVTQAVRDISAVKNWTDKIQQEFNTIAADLRGSKNQLQIKHGELSSLLGQNQIRNATLQNYLQSIEKANNDIVNERQNWATEKSRLQNELRNVGREAQICKTSFGTLPSTQKPVSNTNIKLSFCGFENPPLCGYTQDGGDSFDWTRGSNTLHSSTGPKQDHTFGNPSGHYLYIDAYNQATHTSSSRTSHARITSPEFPPASGYCIFFWYNMHGSDIKDFKMYAKVGNGLGYPVYEHSGEIDENWHLVKVNLDSEYTANSFRVVFEGNTNAYRHYSHSSYSYYNRNGNIGIDDVYVYNTSCYNIPSTPPGTYNYTNGTQSTSYTFHSTPMSWYDAKIVCKNEGPSSNLISVNSQEEQEFIVNTIKASESLRSTGMYGFYTSGNDKRIEKTFDWTDTGTPYTTAYQNWHTGQPNNVGGNQNCLLLQYPEAWEWGDVNCNDKHPFICEINNT